MAVEEEKQPLPLLEEALRALAKLLKAVRFYPPGHPLLRRTVEETHRAFAPLTQNRGHLLVAVGKGGFQLGEEAVAPNNAILKKLAHFLFARRLNRMMILPDLSPRDLFAFTRCLLLEPGEIQKRGGLQEVLIKSHVSTLWVNVTELDTILERKEELDREKQARLGAEEKENFFAEDGLLEGEESAAVSASAEEPLETDQELEAILRELLVAETDQRYRLLLEELVPLVLLNLNEEHRHVVLEALNLLCRNATDRDLSMPRREFSLHALNQLTTDELLEFLVAILCTDGAVDGIRRRIIGILAFLKEKAVPRLMDRLAEENTSQARKFLTEALIRIGGAAVPTLAEYLDDPRWFVVRNTVTILGEIRAQEAIECLTALLSHKDIRVRRETIRALTKIGGPEVVDILLYIVETGEDELRRQALLSLGAMKNPAALPTLLKLVLRPDPMVKRAEIKKGAIKALGEIGSAEAASTLRQVLKHRKLWKRSRFDEVRTAAALALGEIGDEDSVALLESALDDRSEPVARAAAQALKQLKKGEDHD